MGKGRLVRLLQLLGEDDDEGAEAQRKATSLLITAALAALAKDVAPYVVADISRAISLLGRCLRFRRLLSSGFLLLFKQVSLSVAH